MSLDAASAERELFEHTVVCAEEFPIRFEPGALDATRVARISDHAEAVLRALAMIEDAAGEDADEPPGHNAGIARLDAKINLLLDLVGTLVRGNQAPLPMSPLRWSRNGASLCQSGHWDVGQTGRLLIQPTAWLPQRLELPAELIAIAADQNPSAPTLWLRFDGIPASLKAALERHLFRLHRRAVARRNR